MLSFENYDSPKNDAYLQNNIYFEKLKGKNNYEKIFFIQYLFEPNLLSFSEAKMGINYEEFNACVNDVILKFKSSHTEIEPFDLIEKLKCLS